MKRLVLFSAAVALLAAIVATSALAKGASEATITGPGLGKGSRSWVRDRLAAANSCSSPRPLASFPPCS